MEGAPTTESNATLPEAGYNQAFGSPEEREQDLQTQVAGALGGQDASGAPPANGNGVAQYRHPNLVSRINYHMQQNAKRRRMQAV